MLERVKENKKENRLAGILSNTKSKYIVGTVLLSGIGVALPRIFHILAGSSAGAMFLPMHIVLYAGILFAAINVFGFQTYGISVIESIKVGLPGIIIQLASVPFIAKAIKKGIKLDV